MSEPRAARRRRSGATGVPDDANDLRGFHFSRLMRKPLTWILIAVLVAIAAGVAGASSSAPRSAPARPLVALLLGARSSSS